MTASATHPLAGLDSIIALLAAVVSAAVMVAWALESFRDPLAHALPRRFEFREDSILAVVCIYLLGAGVVGGVLQLVGAKADEVGPRLLTGAAAHLAGTAACLVTAGGRGSSGARAFLLGEVQTSAGRALVATLALTCVGIALCPAIAEWTAQGMQAFIPDFGPARHPTLVALDAENHPAWVRAGLWCSAALIAPVAEEIFFRGMLQTFLVRRFHRRWTAVALVSIVFGAVHFGQAHTVPALVFLGLLLGFLYERTGALVYPIVAHALFNLKTLAWENWTAT